MAKEITHCKHCGKEKTQREKEPDYNFKRRKYCSDGCRMEATKHHRYHWVRQ